MRFIDDTLPLGTEAKIKRRLHHPHTQCSL